jgi:hypothetical protein
VEVIAGFILALVLIDAFTAHHTAPEEPHYIYHPANLDKKE